MSGVSESNLRPIEPQGQPLAEHQEVEKSLQEAVVDGLRNSHLQGPGVSLTPLAAESVTKTSFAEAMKSYLIVHFDTITVDVELLSKINFSKLSPQDQLETLKSILKNIKEVENLSTQSSLAKKLLEIMNVYVDSKTNIEGYQLFSTEVSKIANSAELRPHK